MKYVQKTIIGAVIIFTVISSGLLWVSAEEGVVSRVLVNDFTAIPGNAVNWVVSGITPRGGINYVPLQPVPGVPAGNADFKTYLIAGFKIGISVAGILSVLMLVVAGFQYATTDAFTGKEESKNKMTKVVYGLVLILVSYILLNTVNKDTVSLKLDFGTQDAVNRIGGGFTGGLSTLRYNQAQTVLNNTIRASLQSQQASQKSIDTLGNEITSLKNDLDAITEGGDPDDVMRLRALITDKEIEKAILDRQQESSHFAAVYETRYQGALQSLNDPGLNKASYDKAKSDYSVAEANYLKLKASLEAGDQASRDAAKALELRWNTQSTNYIVKLRDIEQKYPSFLGNNSGYTGQNYFVPGTPVR